MQFGEVIGSLPPRLRWVGMTRPKPSVPYVSREETQMRPISPTLTCGSDV